MYKNNSPLIMIENYFDLQYYDTNRSKYAKLKHVKIKLWQEKIDNMQKKNQREIFKIWFMVSI